MGNENKESRAGIINAVSKPIQLAALVVLVVEGLLAYLLSKANAKDITLYVVLMVATLVLTILAVFVIQYQEIRLKHAETIPATGEAESTKKTFKWDVFLAAPMAALTNDDFKKLNAKILEVKRVLEVECNFKSVFYAGDNMVDQKDFDSADISIATDIDAIKDSKYFVLIYTEKIVSSVLFEAGIALALGKPSFYFGDPDNFPFLMREANNSFNFVKIHDAASLDDIILCISKNRNKLFEL
jgi:hypothetical protein